MKRRFLSLWTYSFVSFVAISCFDLASIFACNSLLTGPPDRPLVGKSFDWHNGAALITVNPRGIKKRALSFEAGSTPVTWDSRFGSITFNQLGPGVPYSGMNEKGLTVESLSSPEESRRSNYYPGKDNSPTTNESQIIQLILDTAETTEEAIETASSVRITQGLEEVHYFICDASSTCAVVDFEGGELKIFSKESLHARIATNGQTSRVQGRMKELKRLGWNPQQEEWTRTNPHAGPEVRLGLPPEDILGPAAESYPLQEVADPIGYVFDILEKLKRRDTQWQVVHDIQNRTMYFRTPGTEIKNINLGSFDFSDSSSYRVSGLESTKGMGGDIGSTFHPITDLDYEELKRDAGSARYHPILELVSKIPYLQSSCLETKAAFEAIDQMSSFLASTQTPVRLGEAASRKRRVEFSLSRAAWRLDLEETEQLSAFLSPNVDVKNEYGLTPIQLAVTSPSEKAADVVRILLDHGAKLLQTDSKGRTLRELAEAEGGRPEIIELLKSYEAKSAERR